MSSSHLGLTNRQRATPLQYTEKSIKKIKENLRNNVGSADYKASPIVLKDTMKIILNEDVKDILPNIKVPTLLIWGTLDDATPISDAKIMEKLIPNCGLVEYPYGTHFSYLENIENGYRTFLQIQNDRISLEELEESERTTLSIFLTHLNTLYNNTEKGKKEPHKLSNDIKRDVNDFVSLYASKELIDYDLPDRIIKMFCHFAGFDSFEKAKAYATQKPILADQRNRKSSRNSFQLTQGDFIKGIRDIKYLKSILQNGSLAVEFLGASADKDSTPLDTDLSRILKVENSISETVSKTEASGYGSIYLILKNDDRFCITRRSSSEEQGIDEVDINKIEAFYTGATGKDHYGIRTGFASSEIDYIMTKEYDERIGLEIAMNGFYIPVVDTSGNLIFAPEDYDSLRKKMSGLSYFGEKKSI